MTDARIVVCHSRDPRGASYLFADYLLNVSPEWRKAVGNAASLKWPVGEAASGNEGLEKLITQTPGAIGYVDLTYALNAKLTFSQICNAAGEWIATSLHSVTTAAANTAAELPADFRASIANAHGLGADPLCSYTYLLVYAQQSDPVKARAARNFIRWLLHDGQTVSQTLNIAPLPKSLVER